MAKIISIANHKGGVGKTTSSANIGAGLANQKKRVLLIDLDPQMNLSQTFGVESEKYTTYHLMVSDQAVIPVKLTEYLSIIPASADLVGAEVHLATVPGREYIFKEKIDEIADQYDFIIIDNPPSLGLLVLNSFTASNVVYVPVEAEYMAIRGLSKLSDIVGLVQKRLNKELLLDGVFLTKYDDRKVLNRKINNLTREHFGDKVFSTKIRPNISLAEAPAFCKDIFDYAPNSNGARDYLNLCNEIIERMK